MRLSQAQQEVIRATCMATFNYDTNIWIFGSRLNDAQRGGDIDLYVETGPHRLMDELRCKIRLEDELQIPVDLIVRKPDDTSPIATIAKQKGHRL
ncbi:nucleotidyltransferase domain-containing protein [bacterium]|jgi:predicted nucleotidyltransferase|nr:nucleotidyltransferase domain-containing protein [bacterium]